MTMLFDPNSDLAFEEKRAWITGLVALGGYAAYLVAMLRRAGDTPLTEMPYVGPLLWCVGGAIVATMALHLAIAIAAPREANQKDQRDREIERFGEYVGQSFLVIGGVAALILAMAEQAHFWIANAVYLAFVLASALSALAKIVAYRRGLPSR